MSSQIGRKISPPKTNALLLLGPMAFVLLAGFYFVARYNGNWAETDTSTLTAHIYSFMQGGQIISNYNPYPNGFAFQVISDFIITITGIDLKTLQQLMYPLLSALVVLPAWIAYRELVGSAKGATITVILLFTQPEFLFVILRSTHEKFTRSLLFLSLFWLSRSFRSNTISRIVVVYILLFYLTIFAMITSNNLLSNSFIFAFASSFALGWVLEKQIKLRFNFHNISQKLTYVAITCIILGFIFIFYIYEPAREGLLALRTLWEKTFAVYLDVQVKPSNSYAQVADAWVSMPIYFILSIANWIILIASFIIWANQTWQWIIKKNITAQTKIDWFLWLLYTSFGLQGIITVITDSSGYIGNLQHRLFSTFIIVAVAMVGNTLSQWKLLINKRLVSLSFALMIFIVAILSLLKAANEPIFSNKWTFYNQAEISDIKWADSHLVNSKIWTEFDERLLTAYEIEKIGLHSANGNILVAFSANSSVRTILITNTTRLRSLRMQKPLPVPMDAFQIYDSGNAQLYHLKPLTLYQR